MLIYDISKSNYGLNPIHVFRLSEKALDTFEKIDTKANISKEKINLV